MKRHVSSSRTEACGKLEPSKANPNIERLAQHTTWNFGNAETLEALEYRAISFPIPCLFTQLQWLMVRTLLTNLISYIPRTKAGVLENAMC